MPGQIELLNKLESCVNIENVTLQLLVNSIARTSESSSLLDMVMHHHSYTELFVCGSGEIIIDSQDGPIRLGSGDAAIVPTNFLHGKRADDSDAKWLTVGFCCVRRTVRDCRDLYRRFEVLTGAGTVLVWRNIPGLYRMMESIMEMCQNQSSLLPAMELAQILLRLAEQMPADAQTASQPEIQPDAADLDIRRMAVLDHLINSCFTSDFSDSEVAQHLYLSERQLSRIVQKWYGNTLRRIIIEKRIITAAQLLQKANTPTDQIGYLVGFQSKSVFSREFQKLYGVTPAVYRKTSI